VTGPQPLFRVVKGDPSDEETAALIAAVRAVVAARARAGRSDSPAGNWASHARALRVRMAPGPEAWRRSALPS
jgi:Acyl-CoA carboxylase epsilon subunit